jgi:hypothetical protein
MTPQATAEALRKALRAIYSLDSDTALPILDPNQRSELLALANYVQIALDRCKTNIVHAPRDTSAFHAIALADPALRAVMSAAAVRAAS